MERETVQKILDTANRVFAELGEALELKAKSYEEVIQAVKPRIEEYGNKTLSELLFDWAKKMLPPGSDDISVEPVHFALYVAAIDTPEKSQALLLMMPEPDPQRLDAILTAIRLALPTIRQVLLPIAKRLPHPPGGRPKKLTDPVKRQDIRTEIGLLLAQGVDLKDAEKRLADREDAGVTTIHKIWRENKKKGQRH